jgi:hypothetical protein
VARDVIERLTDDLDGSEAADVLIVVDQYRQAGSS